MYFDKFGTLIENEGFDLEGFFSRRAREPPWLSVRVGVGTWGFGGRSWVLPTPHGGILRPKSSTPPARPLPGRVPLQKTVFQLLSNLFLGGRGVFPGSQPGFWGVSGGTDAGYGSYPSTVRWIYATRCAAPRARPSLETVDMH